MKRIKVNGYVILLLLLAVAYGLVEWYRPEPVKWTRTYINTDKIPYGTYALFHLLDEVYPDMPLEVIRVPPYNLLEDSTVSGNYLFIGPDFKADKFDQESLLNFVEEGNTAFIAAETFPPAFLDALRVRTHTSLIGSDSLIHFVNPELGSRKYVLPLRSLSTWFSAIDSSSEDSPEKMTNALATADSSATFGSPSFFSITESLSGKSNFIRVPYGNGNFYLHSQPIMFSNYHLLRNQGHEYAFRALSYLPAHHTWWDEYYKQGRVGSRSLFGIIAKYPTIRWAWYLLLFGLLLYVIFRGKRRQRVIPQIEPPKNTSLEFAGVVSSLYYNQRDFKDIGMKKAWYFEEFLRNRDRKSTRLNSSH